MTAQMTEGAAAAFAEAALRPSGLRCRRAARACDHPAGRSRGALARRWALEASGVRVVAALSQLAFAGEVSDLCDRIFRAPQTWGDKRYPIPGKSWSAIRPRVTLWPRRGRPMRMSCAEALASGGA